MLTYECYNKQNLPTTEEKQNITRFLFQHLDQYGDPAAAIQKAIDYSLSVNDTPGGFVMVARSNDKIVSAVVVNKTGMKDYIPENILVYIATDVNERGKGIGKTMLQKAVNKADGDVALHVEPDNPAKRLYENLGFTQKYLEMRLKKEA